MADRICSIDNCTRQVAARGWCHKHWARWRRNGDPVKPKPRQDLAVDHQDGTRTCKVCDQRLPITQFDRDKGATGGRRAQCKKCRGQKVSDWYYANQEVQRERIRQRRRNNIDKAREYENKRYQRDREKRIELATESAHRRRKRIANSERIDRGITVTALRKKHGDRCHLCNRKMDFKAGKHGVYNPRRASIEHLTPIHHGGLHVWENVVLSCLACNLRRPKLDDEGGEQLLLIS